MIGCWCHPAAGQGWEAEDHAMAGPIEPATDRGLHCRTEAPPTDGGEGGRPRK